MQRSLTKGPITGSILLFALPLMLGNLLQQMYNIADTWVVGRFLGADALAAVGSSYTLMTFLTSILLGLCMGSGAAISMQYGSGEQDRMRQSVFLSFTLIAGISLVLNVLVYLGLDGILWVLRVPEERAERVHTGVVEGQKCLLIPIEEGESASINGVDQTL